MTSLPTNLPPPSRQALLLVAFMWFAYFLNYCDRQAVFSMFPVLKSDLGFTDTQLGYVGASFLWIYGVGSFFAGQIGDKFSKRRLIVWSLALWSLVTIATGLANSPNMVLALRALMGISEALFMPAAIALTANAFPPATRSRAIAALTTAQILGNVGGGWFGGWMAQQGQWRTAFFALGAVGLVFALPYFAFLRGVSEEAQVETKKSGGSGALVGLAQTRTYWLLCVVFPVFVFGLWLLYGWLPNFLHEKFALGLADAAFNATVFLQGATLVGMLSGGVLADTLYRRTKAARLWLLTASLLGCAPFLHYLGNSDTLAATRVAAMGFGLFSGFFMGNIFPSAFEIVPADARASAVGVLNLFGAVISGFATLAGGALKQSVGINHLLTYTALAYVLAGLAVIAGIRFIFPRDYERVH
ncbi:MAG: major facilitator transporter [Limisphaerales bacterium]|nr:MAG: major facilitator transporter [Limisphaerales bacterium]KAG0508629.1 MAG: major facilitator transporter [Limisphaerales bacterium]TXT48701.1 MAG: major facilitator transporter [Limisphaerales bacterium]